jgi:acyl carrier protein
VEKIADDATLHTLRQMDSLSFAALVVELEKRAGGEIDAVELLELRSVRDVAMLLDRYR